MSEHLPYDPGPQDPHWNAPSDPDPDVPDHHEDEYAEQAYYEDLERDLRILVDLLCGAVINTSDESLERLRIVRGCAREIRAKRGI